MFERSLATPFILGLLACGPIELAELPALRIEVVDSQLEFSCPEEGAPVSVPADRHDFSLDCLGLSCTVPTPPDQSECQNPASNPLLGSCFETVLRRVWRPSGACGPSTRATGFNFESGHEVFQRTDRLYFELHGDDVVILAEGQMPAPFSSAYARYLLPLDE